MQKMDSEEDAPLCEAPLSKYAVLVTSKVVEHVDCFNCVIRITDTTNFFSFRLQDAVPLGYMIDADCAVPTTPIPVYAYVDGKKVKIGEGTIDPETFLFTTKVDASPEAKQVMDYIRGTRDANGKMGAGMIEVSEVTLKAGVRTLPTDGPSEDNDPSRKSL